MASVYGGRSLYNVRTQSEYHYPTYPRGPATTTSESFSRISKRAVSRDPIASDSDARNIQALAKFLRTKQPPSSSFTSQPEHESRGPNLLRKHGPGRRRNSIFSLKNSKNKRTRESIQRSVASSLREEPYLGQERLPSIGNSSDAPTQIQQMASDTARFEIQKYEIAAAISRLEQGSGKLDLQSLLQKVAMLGLLDNQANTSQRTVASVSTTDVDHEMELWHSRSMSINSNLSQDGDTLRYQREGRAATPSVRPIRREPSRSGIVPQITKETPPPASKLEDYRPRRRGSIETIRTQRKERVSALRKRDILALKNESYTPPTQPREKTVQADTQSNSASSANLKSSAALWNPLGAPTNLWKPSQTTLAQNSSPSSRLWQPQFPISPPKSDPESEPAETDIKTEQETSTQPNSLSAANASDIKDAQIREITKCLTELQQQNALMMQALVAVTNIKSGYQDMALLAEKLERSSGGFVGMKGDSI